MSTGRELKDLGGLIDVESINTRDHVRLRPVSDAGVQSVMSSIVELGVMKDPIHLRLKRARKGYEDWFELIAGGHRLEAAKRLGWEVIPARVWECSDAWARLMEVDDNLAGAELSPLDTAVFLVERKRLYEELHPETKAGVAGAASRWENANDTMSFASATAEKFGVNKRTIERLIAAGSHLHPTEVVKLRGAPKQPTLADLAQLSKLADATRRDVVRRMCDGTAKSAAKAIKATSGQTEREKRDPADAAFDTLVAAWSRAPQGVKARFRRYINAGLAPKDDDA